MLGRARLSRSLRELTDRLYTDDQAFERLQRALRAALAARRKVDRNLLRVFAAMNVPSYTEVAQVEEQVALLEEDLARVSARIGALVTRLEAREQE